MADKKVNIVDTLVTQVPDHILEAYPRFFDFVEAYYEWATAEGSAYDVIQNHTDYLSFVKSLEAYIEAMKAQYLSSIPDNILFDKETFIKWSRKFNIARGSHASIKFLFKILFNEQGTNIYIPKNNVFSLSDNKWVAGENIIYVTHSLDNIQEFNLKKITQEREIYPGIFRYASGIVQRVRTKYSGRFVLTELVVSSVNGEFLEGYPIKTVDGIQQWPISTISSISVEDGGSGYQLSDRITIDDTDYIIERVSEQANVFDTRISTLYLTSDITLNVNSVPINDFTFDGRYVYSPNIAEGDTVSVSMPGYGGYIVIDAVNRETGTIMMVDIVEPAIVKNSGIGLTVESSGTGALLSMNKGMVKPIKGYFENTKSFVSSNQYLQDSFFYQTYSYAIKTEHDFTRYADVVKRLVHPSGFLMFGQINILSLYKLALSYRMDIETTIKNAEILALHKYGLGNNWSLLDRIKDNTFFNHRLYPDSFYDTLDLDYLNGEVGYELESEKLSTNVDYEYDRKKGWMNPSRFIDHHLYIQQDYVQDSESGSNTYFENGYVSDRV